MIRRVGIALALIAAAFFIVRAIVELLTIDYSDPSSYANDWGGPSLAGVLLVHCGLGIVAAVGLVIWWRGRRSPTADERDRSQ